jgi:sugar/nucleoside kinase (ribokinase family)
MTVLIGGDVQVVVSAHLERLPEPGDNAIVQNPAVYVSGVGANVACDLRYLGVAVEVAAAVGDDPYGVVIRQELMRRVSPSHRSPRRCSCSSPTPRMSAP